MRPTTSNSVKWQENSVQWMGENVKGSDCVLTESSLSKLAWKYWEKQRKPQYIPCLGKRSKSGNLPNADQKLDELRRIVRSYSP